MPFVKGRRKTGGKTKGTQNKFTRSAKEAFQLAFDELGGFAGLVKWANDKENPQNKTAFYNLYGRLIPMEVAGDPNAPIAITITRRVIADRS